MRIERKINEKNQTKHSIFYASLFRHGVDVNCFFFFRLENRQTNALNTLRWDDFLVCGQLTYKNYCADT